MKYRAVLWGMGKIYNRLFHTIKYFEQRDEITVVAVTASEVSGLKSVDGYPVKEAGELCGLDFDFVLLLSETHEREIFETAVHAGILAEKLVSYRVMELPWFDFDKYFKLRGSRPSIISNNCWGGVIYHTLGMECLSPFKNLYLEDRDYIKMLGDLRHYLACELTFVKYAIDVHSKEKYPVVALDDVWIHCNHAKSYEEAAKNWNRRVRKINWDNIFVEMYTEDRKIAREFLQIGGFERKICFVPFPCDNEAGMYRLKLQAGQTEFWEAVISNARNGNNGISYQILDLLNGDVCSRCRWKEDAI